MYWIVTNNSTIRSTANTTTTDSCDDETQDINAADCCILRSILMDGRYDISEEDCAALKSVISVLSGTDEQMMEQQNRVEPNSSTEEQTEDKTCSVDELSKNETVPDISTHSANTPFSGEELAKRTPTSESDDIETPDTAAAVTPTKPNLKEIVHM